MTAWFEGSSFVEGRARIDRFVDESADDLVALCHRLVAARSPNPPGDTTGPASVIGDFLSAHDMTSEIVARVDSKPNLVSTCHSGEDGNHLVFNGHLDTLQPGDEAAWQVPVYELSCRDGRLYGLGIGNMKAAVAALSSAFVFLSQNRDLWHGQLSMTAVADETVFGPDGAGYLLEMRPDLYSDALICGEGPGQMNLAIAEKGVCWIEVKAKAEPGQGMLSHRGTSAIARLAEAITEVDALNDETATPPEGLECLVDHAGEHGLRLSANVGTIGGGHFVSQVASRAVCEIDFRIPPGMTVADVEAHVAAIAKRHSDVSWRRIKAWDPNWTAPASPIAASVAKASEAVRSRPSNPVVRLPASDASRWRARGVPAVCYGPQPTLASGVNDYVEVQDLLDCVKVYALAALAFFDTHA
ncbi:MAG: M20 family metallopeptidase [Alphaproteobacteria bacterium]|nr:M20 family metallopeptidase [Alphaproteobacteria bacterium]